MVVADSSLMHRTLEHVCQFVCGLRGHDALLHFEKGRMSLQCTSCGYETPGWDVKGRPGSSTPSPRRAVRMPLVGERRAA
jgi:hypothetical protein